MIKKVKLFINDNETSKIISNILRNKLLENKFDVVEDNFDLGISVGGDGSFLRMIKSSNFDSDPLYVGINSGTLGFLQEVKVEKLDEFIEELKSNKYLIEEIGIQETRVNSKDTTSIYYSLNDIVLRDKYLKTFKCNIKIDNNEIEDFVGDGILIATSTGSTAHNLSFGGSIVYNTFTSLQITPIAPINSSAFRTIPNSIIIPDKKIITIVPKNEEVILTVDGENNFYKNVDSVETTIDNKKIKFLRFSYYNFPQKINEKLINNEKV